ncbi:hypothetical protein HG530_005062 [Fusarium avenaceum]|nr:hypothetical protein HG530_005062 [Fusarium avenaceum]
MDDLGKLVYSLACVIRLGIDILGTKVSPLETIHRAQIANFTMVQSEVVKELAGAIAVPDLNTGFAEAVGRCVALDEPEELGDNGASKDTFRGEERKNGDPVVVKGEF